MRPIGPQRTNSIKPSFTSAFGAIIMVPPVNLLLLKVRKFTGGTMMIAPKAEVNDGLIEFVRWGPIGRMGLVRNLPKLYDGTHIDHPLAERQGVKQIDFFLDAPVDVMVDGETFTLHCQKLDVLPSALNVVV